MRKTVIVRRIKKLHEEFANLLLSAHPQTLRRAAVELDAYFREHKHLMDAQFMAYLVKHLEHAIQDIGKTPWSVARSKQDLRGRKPTHRKRAQVDPAVRDSLHKKTQSFFDDLE